METVVRSHPWEIAGLGRAPFKLVNVYIAPGKGDGCHYCGTGIKQIFQCVSSDGNKFHVGCDCIERCHLPSETIVVEAKRAQRAVRTQQRREKQAVSRKAAKEAREAQWAAEREAIKVALATNPLYLRLSGHAVTNGFLAEMVASMERWGALTEKQEAAAVRVMDRIESEPARKAASQYLGAVGDRVSLVVTVEMSRCIYAGSGSYYDPDRYLNKFRTEDGNAVTWFSAKSFKEGAKLTGTAKIKKTEEYNGERQTVITNPRWRD